MYKLQSPGFAPRATHIPPRRGSRQIADRILDTFSRLRLGHGQDRNQPPRTAHQSEWNVTLSEQCSTKPEYLRRDRTTTSHRLRRAWREGLGPSRTRVSRAPSVLSGRVTVFLRRPVSEAETVVRFPYSPRSEARAVGVTRSRNGSVRRALGDRRPYRDPISSHFLRSSPDEPPCETAIVISNWI
jgi:hypothetical protein